MSPPVQANSTILSCAVEMGQTKHSSVLLCRCSSPGEKSPPREAGDYLAVTLGVCRLGETGFVYLFDVFNIRVSDKGLAT